jgi:hypothetical protein
MILPLPRTGPVEALQVAVDDEDQVVELLARREADRTERLGLVHLAVAAEDPDLAVFGIRDAARMQVPQEARLVDRHQGAEPHRDRRELPELGHQLRVRIARQTLAGTFLAEIEHLLLGDAPFEVGAGIDAGCAVALDVEQVAAVAFALGMPEVVEARGQHVSERREARDVPAEVAAVLWMQPVRLDDQRHRVPAHVGAQAPLKLEVARAMHLVERLDRVDVAGGGRERQVDALLARVLEQLLDQEVATLTAFSGHHGRQGVEPLTRFLGIGIVRCGTEGGFGYC